MATTSARSGASAALTTACSLACRPAVLAITTSARPWAKLIRTARSSLRLITGTALVSLPMLAFWPHRCLELPPSAWGSPRNKRAGVPRQVLADAPRVGDFPRDLNHEIHHIHVPCDMHFL